MERLAPMLKLLGDQESAKLLQTTLEEERQTDQKLVEISEIHN
jgi:ferritin-like metal-binding protein YciE